MKNSPTNQSRPFVSVIIPTHSRPDSLRHALAALACQAYLGYAIEVIVVDDGSEEDLSFVTTMDHPLELRHIRQPNRGATHARNAGALHSQGQLLVFLDDDIDLAPQALVSLVDTLESHPRTIVLGNLRPVAPTERPTSAVAEVHPNNSPRTHDDQTSYAVPFTACMTGVLAVRREDFLRLGMFQDPTSGRGWPNWDDVDFGYRAHLQGFELRRSPDAVATHRDHVLTDLPTSADRWHRAARAAALLFHKHPELQSHLPMFRDKTPISIARDSPTLIFHKAFHGITAWRPVQWGMERLISVLERTAPWLPPGRLLHRWVLSSYIYQGYREGLRDYGPIEPHCSNTGGC